ncbi:MAG: hypothetical protein ACJ79W_12745 [Myxococcales bacterium]
MPTLSLPKIDLPEIDVSAPKLETPSVELPKIELPKIEAPTLRRPGAFRPFRARDVRKAVQEGPDWSARELGRLSKDLRRLPRDAEKAPERAAGLLQEIVDRAGKLAASLPATVVDVAERLPEPVAERVPAVRQRRQRRSALRLVAGGVVVALFAAVAVRLVALVQLRRREQMREAAHARHEDDNDVTGIQRYEETVSIDDIPGQVGNYQSASATEMYAATGSQSWQDAAADETIAADDVAWSGNRGRTDEQPGMTGAEG